MTPTFLRADVLGVLRNVRLALGTLPEGIIAIQGPNGAGKTTVLDAIAFAPYYRAWSSKPGELKDYCAGPARLDLDVEMGGHAYQLRLRIDPAAKGGAGQTDATITRDGVPLTDGTRATDYDLAVVDWPATATAAKPATRGAFPSRRLLMASAFAAQDRSGGFASLGPAERKALFGELLGTEEHQERSARAKARGADLDAEIAAIARDLTGIEASRAKRAELLLTVADGEREHATAADLEATADRALEAAAAEVAAARASLDVAEREARVAEARRVELTRDLATVTADATRAAAGLADLDALVQREPSIRARAADLARANDAITAARAAYEARQTARNAADATLARARAALAEAHAEVARLEAEVGGLDADRAALPAAEARAAHAVDLRTRIDQVASTVADLDARAREAERVRADAWRAANDADARLAEAERRAGLLDGVPCGGGIVYLDP